MAQLRDKPHFSNYGYWPGTPSQWREPTVDDCTWYAGEFAWEAASNTHLSMHPVNALRNKSSDRVGGTPVSVMMREMGRLWPESEGVGWSYGARGKQAIKRALWGGAVVIVGGDYEKLPYHYRRWTNNDEFDHAVAFKFLTEHGTGFYDPLGGGRTYNPYDGEWIAFWSVFRDNGYAWEKSDDRYYVGVVQNKEQGMSRMFVNPTQPSNRKVRVKGNTPVYVGPSVTSKRMRTIWSARWVWHVGNTTNGWRLIQVEVDAGNGIAYGYVHKSDISEMQTVAWPEVEVRPDAEYKALQDANKALQEDKATLVQVNKGLHTRLNAKDVSFIDIADIADIGSKH